MSTEAAESSTRAEQEALGKFIRERRTELGLTQTQLAARVGWVQERISLIENGKYGMPSLPSLARLADALDVRLFEVLATAGFDETEVSASRQTEGMDTTSGASLRVLQQLFAIQATTWKASLDRP